MTRTAITLDELNALDEPGFVAALDGVFEHAPGLPPVRRARGPSPPSATLHDGLMRVVRQKQGADLLAFLNAHPVLGGKEAKPAPSPPSRPGSRPASASCCSPATRPGHSRSSTPAIWRSSVSRSSSARDATPGHRSFASCAGGWRTASIRKSPTTSPRSSTSRASGWSIASTGAGLPQRVRPPVHRTCSTRTPDGRRRTSRSSFSSAALPGRSGLPRHDECGGADRSAASGNAPLRIGTYELVFHMGAYFRARGVIGYGAALPRRGVREVRRQRAGRPLPRAAGGDALELLDLPRQLTAAAQTSLSPYSWMPCSLP